MAVPPAQNGANGGIDLFSDETLPAVPGAPGTEVPGYNEQTVGLPVQQPPGLQVQQPPGLTVQQLQATAQALQAQATVAAAKAAQVAAHVAPAAPSVSSGGSPVQPRAIVHNGAPQVDQGRNVRQRDTRDERQKATLDDIVAQLIAVQQALNYSNQPNFGYENTAEIWKRIDPSLQPEITAWVKDIRALLDAQATQADLSDK